MLVEKQLLSRKSLQAIKKMFTIYGRFYVPGNSKIFQTIVDESTSTHIINDMHGMKSATYCRPNAPVAEVVLDVEEIAELSEFIATLNSTAPFNVDPTRAELADSLLQSMSDESRDPNYL